MLLQSPKASVFTAALLKKAISIAACKQTVCTILLLMVSAITVFPGLGGMALAQDNAIFDKGTATLESVEDGLLGWARPGLAVAFIGTAIYMAFQPQPRWGRIGTIGIFGLIIFFATDIVNFLASAGT